LELTLEQNNTVFKAVLRPPLSSRQPLVAPGWLPGSLVQVAGICDVIYDETKPVMGIWHPQTFQILLRSPADVTVLQWPSWWTPVHVLFLLGGLAVLSLLVSGGVLWGVRRRLAEQVRRRAMAETEFSAILSERNRLAREIHDTLAQGLTATSVQLQLAKIHAAAESPSVGRDLDQALQMVRDCLEEARNSIWNMRPQVLETGDLTGALKNILQQLSAGIVGETRFEVTGRERRLSAVIETNVLRLGQEAVTNAVKHARASQVRMRLEFGEKYFTLTVADDGRGFDPASPPPSEGGFGLVGIKERAQALNGKLTIRSAAHQGTEINVRIPLLGE
jgi:signal transduction histidine kinase